MNWRNIAQFLIPALFGIPLGWLILHRIDVEPLRLIVAGLLLLYGVFFTFRRDLPRLTHSTPILDRAIGFAGGILGGVAGLSGALPTMWLAMRNWSKEQSRSVLQPFNFVVLSISAGLLAIDGTYDQSTLTVAVIALPATMIAGQFGIFVFKRLSDMQFRRLLIVLMFVSGALLVIREFF